MFVKKMKNIFLMIKFYLKVLLNFKDLNKYIRLSSIFLNRLENILSSDDNIDNKYNNICKYFSDFKVDYVNDDFVEGVDVKNDFD